MKKLVLIRNSITLPIIGLYVLFSSGFMQIRIPSSGSFGVPVGELLLLAYLVTMKYTKILSKLGQSVFIIPFLVWWGLGLFKMLLGTVEHGFWAFRDAIHVIESLFLLAGFTFFAHPERYEKFFQLVPKFLVVVFCYSLTYPFRDILAPLSPTIIGAAGNVVHIFFTYQGISALLLISICYLFLFKKHSFKQQRTALLSASVILAYTLFLFQSRILYLQWIAINAFMFIYRPKVIFRVSLILLFFLFIVFLVSISGIEIKGRLGQPVNAQLFINHFMAIFGVSAEGVEGPARGVDLRLGWWIEIYNNLTESLTNLLFGLGYGQPLTDYSVAGQVPVREPHNSYISVIARLGIVGFIAFLWAHFSLFHVWRKSFQLCKQAKWKEGENRLLLVLFFFICVLVISMGEDGFEKPFYTIPYYFLWGMVLRTSMHLKHGLLPLQASKSVNSSFKPISLVEQVKKENLKENAHSTHS